jgi:two-component system, chemotaxis family, chemotaxis protein CheY
MKSILAVDDSATMRALLSSALRASGHSVQLAEDGMAALDTLRGRQWAGGRPDLVITDINMPRMDGFELIETIRLDDRLKSLPILVLTTESSPEKRARARSAGASGWIVKPFSPEKIDAAIRLVCP